MEWVSGDQEQESESLSHILRYVWLRKKMSRGAGGVGAKGGKKKTLTRLRSFFRRESRSAGRLVISVTLLPFHVKRTRSPSPLIAISPKVMNDLKLNEDGNKP